jgi:hypothetical protein
VRRAVSGYETCLRQRMVHFYEGSYVGIPYLFFNLLCIHADIR